MATERHPELLTTRLQYSRTRSIQQTKTLAICSVRHPYIRMSKTILSAPSCYNTSCGIVISAVSLVTCALSAIRHKLLRCESPPVRASTTTRVPLVGKQHKPPLTPVLSCIRRGISVPCPQNRARRQNLPRPGATCVSEPICHAGDTVRPSVQMYTVSAVYPC